MFSAFCIAALDHCGRNAFHISIYSTTRNTENVWNSVEKTHFWLGCPVEQVWERQEQPRSRIRCGMDGDANSKSQRVPAATPLARLRHPQAPNLLGATGTGPLIGRCPLGPMKRSNQAGAGHRPLEPMEGSNRAGSRHGRLVPMEGSNQAGAGHLPLGAAMRGLPWFCPVATAE